MKTTLTIVLLTLLASATVQAKPITQLETGFTTIAGDNFSFTVPEGKWVDSITLHTTLLTNDVWHTTFRMGNYVQTWDWDNSPFAMVFTQLMPLGAGTYRIHQTGRDITTAAFEWLIQDDSYRYSTLLAPSLQSQSWATPQPVPEPATLTLMGAGLLALFMLRRRKPTQ